MYAVTAYTQLLYLTIIGREILFIPLIRSTSRSLISGATPVVTSKVIMQVSSACLNDRWQQTH